MKTKYPYFRVRGGLARKHGFRGSRMSVFSTSAIVTNHNCNKLEKLKISIVIIMTYLSCKYICYSFLTKPLYALQLTGSGYNELSTDRQNRFGINAVRYILSKLQTTVLNACVQEKQFALI